MSTTQHALKSIINRIENHAENLEKTDANKLEEGMKLALNQMQLDIAHQNANLHSNPATMFSTTANHSNQEANAASSEEKPGITASNS